MQKADIKKVFNTILQIFDCIALTINTLSGENGFLQSNIIKGNKSERAPSSPGIKAKGKQKSTDNNELAEVSSINFINKQTRLSGLSGI
jgi:hypothetical protein